MAEATENTAGKVKGSKIGKVAAKSGAKTIAVAMDSLVRHPKYGKYIHRRTKLAVDDPQSAASVGDVVEIVPCRRVSKNKSWRLVRVIRPGAGVEA